MSEGVIYAHSTESEDKSTWQTLESHLQGVAELAAGFGRAFGAEKWTEAVGLLHDDGKQTKGFQKRLEGGPKVDHSTAGARQAVKIFGPEVGWLLAYAIAGHHGGMPDGIDSSKCLNKRLKSDVPLNEVFAAKRLAQIDLRTTPIHPRKGRIGFQLAMFMRMVFSCLVDADFLDTEAFLDLDKAVWRKGRPVLRQLASKLDTYLEHLRGKIDDGRLNQRRNEILEACLAAAKRKPGLFSLTVPTGGGKTISSLAFALRHALAHGMERIIYVIPYTSIIEQNAAVFRAILGDDAVLEHHSNIVEPTGDGAAMWQERRRRLAAENWDAPVVVTTNVQFFESLMSNKPTRCRKLHNMARSVVILDEAQMLPRDVLLPCVESLRELAGNYGSSVVFCTATQPALSDADSLGAFAVRPIEIAPNPAELYEAFRRVRVRNLGICHDPDIAHRILELDQVLCIVNTRKHARELFRLIRQRKDRDSCFHLSALMYPAHRKQKLDIIRQRLKDELPCLVISTQLIEAGVDIDFPVVFRAMAGIDSIAQAAGRCNREGKLDDPGQVFVFNPAQVRPHGSLLAPAQVSLEVMPNFEKDPLCLDAVLQFFELLFWKDKDKLDVADITGKELYGGGTYPKFATIAERFKYFDSPGRAVFICRDEKLRKKIIGGLTESPTPGKFARMAQPYTVQLYEPELNALLASGSVELIGGIGLPVLKDMEIYDDNLGLVVEGVSGFDPEKMVY